MEFTTFDRDNDAWSDGNCADGWGANWWGNCGSNNMNGKYGANGDIGKEFMWWKGFWRRCCITGMEWDGDKYTSLKSMTLMFRQAV